MRRAFRSIRSKRSTSVLNGEAKYTDYMQLDGGVRGINIIGTGIDVEILQRCRRSKILRGKLQYIFSLVISLFKFKNYSVRTECNGQEHRYQSLIACVGNGTTLGRRDPYVSRGGNR